MGYMWWGVGGYYAALGGHEPAHFPLPVPIVHLLTPQSIAGRLEASTYSDIRACQGCIGVGPYCCIETIS